MSTGTSLLMSLGIFTRKLQETCLLIQGAQVVDASTIERYKVPDLLTGILYLSFNVR